MELNSQRFAATTTRPQLIQVFLSSKKQKLKNTLALHHAISRMLAHPLQAARVSRLSPEHSKGLGPLFPREDGQALTCYFGFKSRIC